MNGYLSGFILGLIQGLTEFLPVSSSGHLALAEKLGIGEENVFINLALHLATLLAVIVTMRRPLVEVIKHPLCDRTKFLLLASIPTFVVAGVIRFFMPDTTEYLPLFFTFTAVTLLLPRVLMGKERVTEPYRYDKLIRHALFVGAMQGIACFNGISRSGTTTSAMTLIGMNGKESAENSFLLSIPIIIGSTAAEFMLGGAKNVDVSVLAVGAITAFIVGIVAINVFLKVMRKGKLWLFSIYAFGMAIASFCLLFR